MIESNVGRPTGRSVMGETTGAPLLHTMYADAAGLTLPAVASQSHNGAVPGWVDVRRDAMASYYYWRRGELSVGEWAADLRKPVIHAVASRRDPVPFLLEVLQSARKFLARKLRGLAPRVPARGKHAKRCPRTTAASTGSMVTIW